VEIAIYERAILLFVTDDEAAVRKRRTSARHGAPQPRSRCVAACPRK